MKERTVYKIDGIAEPVTTGDGRVALQMRDDSGNEIGIVITHQLAREISGHLFDAAAIAAERSTGAPAVTVPIIPIAFALALRSDSGTELVLQMNQRVAYSVKMGHQMAVELLEGLAAMAEATTPPEGPAN